MRWRFYFDTYYIACLYGFLTFFSLPQEENKLFLLHYMWVFVEYLYLMRSMYEDDEYQLYFSFGGGSMTVISDLAIK